MANFEEFQQDAWIAKFRQDFYHRFAYGFQDPEDVFSSIVTDVLFSKLPTVPLAEKSNPAAFVKAMFRNRAYDYFRRHHKRHQPPSVLVNLGDPFPQIFYEYCLGGFTHEAIAEKLNLAIDKVKFWVQWLRKEQSCPQTLVAVPFDELDDSAQPADVAFFNPAVNRSAVEESYSQSCITILARWVIGDAHELSPDNQQGSECSSTSEDKLSEVAEFFKKQLGSLNSLPPLPLSPDELLMLKMLYFEELELKSVGEVLGIEDYQVSYKRNKTLQKLQTYFRQQGIEFDD